MSGDAIGIVLDIGSKYTKAGFAGECFPRAVFPSTVGRFRQSGLVDGFPEVYCGNEAIQKRGISHLTWPVSKGLIQDWDEMEKLWHHIFYKGLLIPPEACSVVHSIHPLCPRKHQEKITEILFESFTINSLYLARMQALALFASGRTTGVVWESGYSCSYAAPVFEGFPLRNATFMSPVDGETLSGHLQKLLATVGYSFTTKADNDILDQIKSDKCYVALDYDDEVESGKCSGDDKHVYTLPDGQEIFLGPERFQCPELMFRPNLGGLQCPSLVDLLCKSIENCDLDYQRAFYENVVIAGGSTMFPGIVDRLQLELTKKLLKRSENWKVLVDAMTTRQFAVWNGGSIMASLSTMNGFLLSKEEYEDNGSDRVKHLFF
ncbi:uncharacterized protein LOC101743052 [Bombyx mori]|uniref:Uncharacterized protein n=1 Tax=Bombyx mori TaxID=7091 RepID=A0A8R2ASC6_BOMMO|nr:actin-52 [Bombyx mori]